ncbi:MAG: DUF938 domain-containing protein [Marinicaulis sp.]|nr:DUF938 domain-containing protein [Marinicaulis sp.]
MANEKSEKELALEIRTNIGARMNSPSAQRNRDPIRDAFSKSMPTAGTALEVAGGTGEHAVHLARAFPELHIYTGDPDEKARASIASRIEEAGLENLTGPHHIDVMINNWGVEEQAPYDAIIAINMIHIAPIEAVIGLMRGADRLLERGGKLFLYGPFRRDGEHTAPSNEAFDADLKSRDERWGVRDLEQEIVPIAQKNRIQLEDCIAMPANNFSAIFGKT